MLADLATGKTLAPTNTAPESIPALLAGRGVEYVTFADWLRLDALEQARGLAQNRPRVKFTRVDEMLQALRESRSIQNSAGS